MTYSTHIPQQKDAAAVGVFFCVHIDKKHRKEEKKIMSKTIFSYVDPIKKDLHDTEVDIYANGVNVGCITRNRPSYCALADTFSVCGFGTQNDDYYRYGNCIRRNVTTIAGAKMAFKKWFESQCWEDIKAAAPKDNLRHISEPEALTSYVCGQAFHMVDWRREGIDVLNPICADPSELVLHTCLRRFAGDYKNERKVSLHHTAYRGEDYLDYVIEEESLRSEMLKKGYRVVYDNFCDFQTFKEYSLIMFALTKKTPSYADFARWVAKASSMLSMSSRGGQFLAIVPADIIAADASLRVILKQINASVSYVSSKSEQYDKAVGRRPAWAIIYADIEAQKRLSSPLLTLNKVIHEKDGSEDGGILHGKDNNLLRNSIADFRRAVSICDLFIDAYEEVKPFLRGQIELTTNDHAYWRDSVIWADCLRKIRAQHWKELLHEIANTSLMPEYIEKEYMKILEDLSEKDLNEFTVRCLVEDIRKKLEEKAGESLLALFDEFASISFEYLPVPKWVDVGKYKDRENIRRKLKFPNLTVHFQTFSWDRFSEYNAASCIRNIERNLHLLDDSDTHISDPMDVFLACNWSLRKAEFTYFTAAFFKNGSVKLKFKESTKILIDRLNIFVGMQRGWLPADYGTKPYEEMDACKQSLIDSFQPREEYDEVVANPDKYIVKNFDVEKLFGFSSAF